MTKYEEIGSITISPTLINEEEEVSPILRKIDKYEDVLWDIVQDNVEELHLPNTLAYIGEVALGYCSNMKRVYIPDSIHEIGKQAFSNCTGLEEVVIDAEYIKMNGRAFYKCNNLHTVTILADTATMTSNEFYNLTNLKTINVGWSEGAVSGAPWGATNATINYNYTGE